MCYREGRDIVPTAGIRPGRMILKFRGCPRGIATQMYLSHDHLMKVNLCHVKWP